jgi:hypothetical protein
MYPEEILHEDEDNGTMPANVDQLRQAVVGHRIVSATRRTREDEGYHGLYGRESVLEITLDNGRRVVLRDDGDCCAYTNLESFFLDPTAVDHVIMGVGTTDGYQTWHIYADYGDILKLQVGWSCGNPFYYGYGFDIEVIDAPAHA